MTIPTTSENAPVSENSQAETPKVVVVDLGKRKRRDVKQLRKGNGKLMDRINELVEQLRSEGAVDPTSRTLVVVVEKKTRKLFRL
ncbi:MAG: hypothetical protein L6R30_26650 [Thermoanaerobaculia bacterium]|nr:hypothetical protein [Thermoanaerobaculia bacterium]